MTNHPRIKERAAFLNQHLESSMSSLIRQYLKDMKAIDDVSGMSTALTCLVKFSVLTIGVASRNKQSYNDFVEIFYKQLKRNADEIEFDGTTYFDEFDEEEDE